MNSPKSSLHLTRRQTIQLLGMSGISYFLGGCNNSELTTQIGNLTAPLNQSFGELLVKMVQPKDSARYVLFQSADKYTESWDIASVVHPQTLLAYQMNGAPIPDDNGAPLRLAAPIKLGYKLSKWVTKVSFVSQIPKGGKGYWEEQGYEWFGGI
jgi:Oxidoreductase molybdopterin binding domain